MLCVFIFCHNYCLLFLVISFDSCRNAPFWGFLCFDRCSDDIISLDLLFVLTYTHSIEEREWQANTVYLNSPTTLHDSVVTLSIDYKILLCQLFNITNYLCVVSRCRCKRGWWVRLWHILYIQEVNGYILATSPCIHSAWLGTVLELVRCTCTLTHAGTHTHTYKTNLVIFHPRYCIC